MRYLPLYVLVFCILSTQAIAQPSEEALNHYRTGYELLKKRNYRNAAIELEQAISINANYGEAHYLLAQSYNVLNEYNKAISAYEKARELGIKPEKAATALGKLYNKAAVASLQQRKYSESASLFDKALQFAPNNAQTHYAMGLSYNGLRDETKAKAAFEKAVKTDPQYAKAHNALADIQHRNREYGPAAITYQKAIDADKKYMAAYGGLARVKFATQDLESIVELMPTALEIDPQYAEGYRYLGSALSQLGRQHEAVAPLRRATELAPKNAEAHFRLGEAHYGMGNYRDAVQAGQTAVRHQKNFAAARVLLGDSLLKLGQLDDARTWYVSAQQDSRFKDYATHQIEEIERAAKQQQ
ncbi:MAG: protein O-GlcNAc transferase [Candidatus Latescibacterota bacterium]|jgi:protein O-GlcNAc transferase